MTSSSGGLVVGDLDVRRGAAGGYLAGQGVARAVHGHGDHGERGAGGIVPDHRDRVEPQYTLQGADPLAVGGDIGDRLIPQRLRPGLQEHFKVRAALLPALAQVAEGHLRGHGKWRIRQSILSEVQLWHRRCGARVFGEDAVREPAEESESVVGNAGQRANMIFVRHIAIVS